MPPGRPFAFSRQQRATGDGRPYNKKSATIAERHAKMTPEEAEEDHRQSVNRVLRQLGKPELPPRNAAVLSV